jgi:hypothetical protein
MTRQPSGMLKFLLDHNGKTPKRLSISCVILNEEFGSRKLSATKLGLGGWQKRRLTIPPSLERNRLLSSLNIFLDFIDS